MTALALWHGWGMQPVAWQTLITQLGSQFDIAPQALPGYGGTPLPESNTLESMADALLAELPSPVTLCGWSIGAMVAMVAAQRQPDKVKRLILIGATPSFVQRADWRYGMAPETLAEFSAAVERDPDAALKRFIALFNQNDENSRMIGRELTRMLAANELPSAALLAAGLALLRDTDLRPAAALIRQPTLLIHGAHDPLMPLPAAQWLAAMLPQAQLEILPDAAHAPFLSDPVHCAALISDFMNA